MSRYLLLIVFLGWMSWVSRFPAPPRNAVVPHALFAARDVTQSTWFLIGYLAVVAGMGAWGRWTARRIDGSNLNVSIKRFNRYMSFARMFIPAWFVVGVYFMGWGTLVIAATERMGIQPGEFDTPGLILGCLPAFLAWMGLWWSQYPADVSIREQGLLAQLDEGLPVHRPPTLGVYMQVNLRLQLLFTIVPVLILVFLRDAVSLGLRPLALNDENSLAIQVGISLLTAAAVFIFAPEILKRILHTEPMADGPLRRRLEAICQRNNIRCKDVLLWRTEHNMGNAAVMGVIPQVRYILMSDLLLETMTDEQIEAVFAHEIGHVIHRHLIWFAIYFVAILLAFIAMSDPIDDLLSRWVRPDATWPAAVSALLGGASFMVLFLYISRKFERQADVFAARTLQREMHASSAANQPVMLATGSGDAGVISIASAGGLAGVMLRPPPVAPFTDSAHVGLYGARAFSSALRQVARINNIPITAWSWCHGSIASRISYLNELSEEPLRTEKFDKFMGRLYLTLMLALCSSGAWAIVTIWMERKS